MANKSLRELTVLSVESNSASNVTVTGAFLVSTQEQDRLLLVAFPLPDRYQEQWSRKIEARQASLAAREESTTLVLDLEVDADASSAKIDSVTVRYQDADGHEFVQVTNQAVEFQAVC